MASNSTKMAGDKGEELAASFLIDNGFELLERNFRYSRYGEIDLIMRKNSLIVFVEVRYKKEKQSINAVHSITKSKLHRLKKTAQSYLTTHDKLAEDEYYRFDLITVEDGEISWIQDIIR
jgi:putative endonuclease